MKIVKITLEDGTENEFKELPLEEFQKKASYRSHFYHQNQHTAWEQDNILPRLKTDLEDWAKDQYSLIDEDEKREIDYFNDITILNECRNRGLSLSEIGNESIINQNFIDRIIEISKRGDDNYIDSVLESLEKLYRIK
ncbi:hypothetical protein [Chryseobacterium sp. MP_3.2]|uniref:hypothetical protein n=1 Tax=Chryseobacterium sp. MP_3.2 TaxID=3071712 RepID=UPI002E011F20|nr:light-regulated signal transduction histidine kinase (bacteriophytochrome) [Chryseobacterium sp. MP_3.2]